MTFSEFEERVRKIFPNAKVDADYQGHLVIETGITMSDAVDRIEGSDDVFDEDVVDDDTISYADDDDSSLEDEKHDEQAFMGDCSMICPLVRQCDAWLEELGQDDSDLGPPCVTRHPGGFACDGSVLGESDVCLICKVPAGGAVPGDDGP